MGKAKEEKQKKVKIKSDRVFSDLKKNWQLYLMILIPVVYMFVFKYIPMYGAQIAFKDYQANKGIFGSEWVGLKHFQRFFSSPQCWQLLRNTLALSLYSLFSSMPLPIILAICFNYMRNEKFKKLVQMVTYTPHFLSTVIIVSLITLLFNARSGVVSSIALKLTGERLNILGTAGAFRHLYVWSGTWQTLGWASILYVSALSGVDPALHEAAMIDGASKWKRVWHIDIPTILPTIAISMVMSMGGVLSVGFDKTFMMQNSINLEVSEVLSTFEYKRGIASSIPDYSYPSAVGLAMSIVNFILVMSANKISNKLSGYGLW